MQRPEAANGRAPARCDTEHDAPTPAAPAARQQRRRCASAPADAPKAAAKRPAHGSADSGPGAAPLPSGCGTAPARRSRASRQPPATGRRRQRSRPRTRRRRCASSRASSASTSRRSRAPARRAASCRRTCRASSSRRCAAARRRGAAAGGDRGGGALNLLPWPKVDFAKFGPIEAEAAVADQEDLRREPRAQLGDDPARHAVRRSRHHRARGASASQLNKENEKAGIKVTMLAFLIKASVAALKKFPDFNASLDGDNLVLKQYFHIGFAADTPNGLVVPVIRDADQKGVLAIAKEMARALREGARRQARPGRHAGRLLLDLARSAASAAPRSRRSSTRRKSRSSACRRARRSRSGTARSSRRG